MMVRGARPARGVVAGQGLEVVVGAGQGEGNRSVLTAMVNGVALEPGSRDAQAAGWITQLGGDPRALLCVLDSLVPTQWPR